MFSDYQIPISVCTEKWNRCQGEVRAVLKRETHLYRKPGQPLQ